MEPSERDHPEIPTIERFVADNTPALLRLARTYVKDAATAEDVVQETWIGFLKGLDSFEGRSSLRTWLYSILINQAKARAKKDKRTVPTAGFSDAGNGSPSVSPDRFFGANGPAPGHWETPPAPWEGSPEERVQTAELRAVVERKLEDLPLGQRLVVTLRDLEGWSAEDVRNVLDITDTNQRVLLHRGRTELRRVLARYLADED